MSIIFYLDDKRNPDYSTGDTYIVARSFSEAVDIIENHPVSKSFDVWDLDHDLDESLEARFGGYASTTSKKTGLDFLRWAAENALDRWPRGKVLVHSANPAGRKNMEGFIVQVEKRLL